MLTTGSQLKAARALAGIEQLTLAHASGISVGTIRNMEAQGPKLLTSNLVSIRSVQEILEAAGIEFLDEGGIGVRMRKAG